jgi:hypothetical protein
MPAMLSASSCFEPFQMRRLSILLLILAIPAPVGAQSQTHSYGVPAAGAPRDGVALRSALAADGGEAVQSAPTASDQPLIAPLPFAPRRGNADAGQCRLACDRAYYFCLAGDDETCPGDWGRCRAGCSS